MQKITYINLANEKIVFQGAPCVLSKVTGLGLPDLDFETIRGVYQQGDTTAGYRRNARTVTVYFTLYGDTRAQLYQYRLNLQAILSPDRAVNGNDRATLIYENDYGRWQTYAIPDGGLEPVKRYGNAQPDMKIGFRCESPYLYAATEDEIEFSYSGIGFSLPFSFPIGFGSRDFSREANNKGQVSVPVQVWIGCKGETPTLLNVSTGKRIALAGPVAEGHTLYINTDPARLEATLTDGEGNTGSAFGQLSLETPIADFFLQPGINRLVYDTGGASTQSTIRVLWRSAYEGV